jgi:non-ribosomal peptide synthetase component F
MYWRLRRLLPNGQIQCLGRIDQQVKVRGYRIELGEIEYVLHAIAGIKSAVVIAMIY